LDTNRAELFWRAIIVAGHGYFLVVFWSVREAGGVIQSQITALNADGSRHYGSNRRPASGRENTRKDFT
jgi:hypothetical protein